MLQHADLPQPSPAAMAVSSELGERIARSIAAAGGRIRFDEYMRAALYTPGLGYYLGGAPAFGEAGDFVTAPEVSAMYGACLAHELAPVLRATDGEVFEFGGGSGALAAAVLDGLQRADALPARYTILELSPALAARQRATLAREVPALADRVCWTHDLPATPIDGAVIANEVLDALPVRVFRQRGAAITERCVTYANPGFAWCDEPADEAFRARVKVLMAREPAPADYQSEFNTGLEPWMSDLARLLRRGVALLVDYGFSRGEYYHPERVRGTLLCHLRHRAHDDPFLYPGLQDITASVDFTHVAEAATQVGLAVLGFTEQAHFLLANDLTGEATRRLEGATEAARHRIAFETKVLTLPQEMGSKFKVIALGSNYNSPLAGFRLRDDRHRL